MSEENNALERGERAAPAAEEEESTDAVEEAVLEGEIHDTKPESRRRRLTRVAFSGPLPHPAVLAQYKDIQPDLPERILRLTEDEAKHRRTLNSRALFLDGIETFIGQVFAFIVALAAFATAGFLGFMGHPSAAAVVGC